MTTLAADAQRIKVLGDINEFPVIASDIIYEGAAVGLVKATGHAQPLTNADRFVGFAESQCDNSAGDAAAKNVRVVKKGVVVLSVTGAVITDVGQAVYAQDDNAFSFLKTAGVFIGFVRRYVSAGVAEVDFDAGVLVDPHEGYVAETVADNVTVDATDSGTVFFVTVDNKVITLGAVGGEAGIRVVNGGAYGTTIITIAPNAADMIEFQGAAADNDKDYINTKATANRGDMVEIDAGDAHGWTVRKRIGTWVRET